jgi:hypothetical protein
LHAITLLRVIEEVVVMQRSTSLFAGSEAGDQERSAFRRSRARILLDVVLGVLGLGLLIGGVRLVRISDSWDYVIVGVAILLAGMLIVRGRISVAGLFPRR